MDLRDYVTEYSKLEKINSILTYMWDSEKINTLELTYSEKHSENKHM